ncbi:MAG: ArnT family glycosyltransferase [Lautropia sp.]
MRPYLVTSFDAGRLPRWIPVLFCAVYAVAGLFGRDPWRTDDAAGFGIALTMATGSAVDWLVPNVHGALAPEGGPLPFWLGAIGIRIAGGISGLLGLGAGPLEAGSLAAIPADLALRIVAALGLATALTLTWYAAYGFGSRPEIQPDDPFGAAASRKDFGRAIADATLLALLACFGLLARVHETTVNAAQVTWIALYLFGLGQTLRRPRIGALLVGLAIAATALTRGLPLAAVLALATLVLSVAVLPYRLIAGWFTAIWLPVALAAGLSWPLLLAHLSEPGAVLMAIGDGGATATTRGVAPAASAQIAQFLSQWLAWNRGQLAGPTLESLGYYAETLAWFFWPLWPFMLWALWRWRGSRREAPLAVPAVLVLLIGALALFDPTGSEAALLPLVLPMAMLTALALPTIRRGLVSVIDWFSVMTFSVVGLAIWAYWIAFMTGYPPRMAQKAQEAVPGFVASLSPVELLLGIVATTAWIALVAWRISRQPRPFWRPVALASGGMVLTWLLLMTLWLPAGNFRKSYRDVAGPARALFAAEPDACVAADGLDRGQRALFAYYARARFIRLPRLDDDAAAPAGPGTGTAAPPCRWLLVSDRESRPHDIQQLAAQTVPPDRWMLVWHGQRRVNRGERLFLYARDEPAMKLSR